MIASKVKVTQWDVNFQVFALPLALQIEYWSVVDWWAMAGFSGERQKELWEDNYDVGILLN